MNRYLPQTIQFNNLLVLLGTVFFLLPSAAIAEEADPLQARLTALAAGNEKALHYEETRESALLSRPVIYQGRLTHDPETGALTKWVDEPRPARLTLQDSRLEAQMGDGRIRTMSLEKRPELGALLGALRAVMSGDAAGLREAFKADYLEGDDQAWLLQLQPRDTTLQDSLTLIEVRGQAETLLNIDTILGDGKRQSLRIVQGEMNPDDR